MSLMKRKWIILAVTSAIFFASIYDASAQRRGRRTVGTPQPETPAPDTTGNPQNNNNNVQPPTFDPYANIPKEYDTLSSQEQVKKSSRFENAFDKSSLTSRTPLAYEHLRWDDAFYAEKVWRELDLREKMNKVFTYEAVDDGGSQMFINLLLRSVNTGEVIAFSDDRFTDSISISKIQELTMGGTFDTAKVEGELGKVVGLKITRKEFDPKSVQKIRIKEEWVFDRESSRMFVRILGIAPVQSKAIPNTNRTRETIPFWIFYPDLRPMLAKSEVYNPKNMGQNRMTWEELFESRMFSSYILRSTIDNPSHKYLSQLYPKEPILRLLEGDNIKEKIFNFEQDLWSY